MCRQLGWFAVFALGTVLLRPPVFAAESERPLAMGLPSMSAALNTSPPAALHPFAPAAAVAPLTQVPPQLVPLARAPHFGSALAARLAVQMQPTEQQTPQRREHKMREDVACAVWGAGIGLTVGLINGHGQVEALLIGAGTGFGVYYALMAAAPSVTLVSPAPIPFGDIAPDGVLSPALRAVRRQPEGLWIMGERIAGKTGRPLKRGLGTAALSLAIGWMEHRDGRAGRQTGGGFRLAYVKRW